VPGTTASLVRRRWLSLAAPKTRNVAGGVGGKYTANVRAAQGPYLSVLPSTPSVYDGSYLAGSYLAGSE
jgi:hypothetical protein